MLRSVKANGPQKQDGGQANTLQNDYNRFEWNLPVISVVMIGEQLNQMFKKEEEAKWDVYKYTTEKELGHLSHVFV